MNFIVGIHFGALEKESEELNRKEGESNIVYKCNLKLQIKASKSIDMNQEDLILKEAVDIPSYLDFRKPKLIMKDIKNKNLHTGKLAGYDNFYLFDEKYDEVEKIVLESNKYSL